MIIKPKKLTIEQLLNKLKNKEFILPIFQRDYTWNKDEELAFFESIKKNKPIGSLTIYSKSSKSKKNKLIIDGQQRITTILNLNDQIKKYKNYEIPYVEWVGDGVKQDPVWDYFVDLNSKGKALDKQDILLSRMASIKIKTPKWFGKDEKILIKNLYITKNKMINVVDNNDNKISLVEAMWIMASKIKNFKNHDIHILAILSYKQKNHENKFKLEQYHKLLGKPKGYLVWMKRIIFLLDSTLVKMADWESDKEQRVIKLFNKILNSKKTLKTFCENIDLSFSEIQNKFNFILKIPTQPNLRKPEKRANISRFFGIDDYIPIYICYFIFKNKKYILNFKENLTLKSNLLKFKIKGLDLVNFASRKPISAGGYATWLTIITSQSSKLFFPKNTKQNRDILVNNIMDVTINDESFTKFTKLIAFWLVYEKLLKIGNGIECYEADHIIPKTYCKEANIKTFSRLGNIDILTRKENRDKNSQITDYYFDNSHINKKYKLESAFCKHFIKKWANANKIDKKEFEKFIENRENWMKKKIRLKINSEAKQK